MAIKTTYSDDKSALVISVDGSFDFSLLSEFRQAYSNDSYKQAKIIVDMRNTSTINSSALGMLLNMQRYLKKSDREIRLINCNNDVKKIFNITHFDKKFTIE